MLILRWNQPRRRGQHFRLFVATGPGDLYRSGAKALETFAPEAGLDLQLQAPAIVDLSEGRQQVFWEPVGTLSFRDLGRAPELLALMAPEWYAEAERWLACAREGRSHKRIGNANAVAG